MESKEKLEYIAKEFFNKVSNSLSARTEDEVNSIYLVREVLDEYKNVEYKFPKAKRHLEQLFIGTRNLLEECYDCLIDPSNKSADLVLRLISENLIVMKCLVISEKMSTNDWYVWQFIRRNKSELNNLLAENKKFISWEKKFKKELEKSNVKYSYEELKQNNYGWAYSLPINHLTLESIAEYCKEDVMFKVYSETSIRVLRNLMLLAEDKMKEGHTIMFVDNIFKSIMCMTKTLINFVNSKHEFIEYTDLLDYNVDILYSIMNKLNNKKKKY